MARVLLVQPRFPVANKSHNHKDYLPVGLLKIASWRKGVGDEVALSLGDLRSDFEPDEVYVTSMFTYWAEYVREAVTYYRKLFPRAHIRVGGVYASLAPDHCLSYTRCDEVSSGVHPQAEACLPDYSLVDTDFQIVHTSRGCVRRCRFCGTYEIEPFFTAKESIADEIVRNHIVFYDNNLLANPNIEHILEELSATRLNGRVVTAESQSGFDGRVLKAKPHLAALLKAARFRNPRVAWDGRHRDADDVRGQIRLLHDAGYGLKDIQVFILYNHDLSPAEVGQKVEDCYRWGVQVADCRFRPLDRFEDGYNSRVSSQQTNEYHVHRGWSDREVRALRKVVRTNNICVRHRIPRERYDQRLEGLSFHQRRELVSLLGIETPALTSDQLDAVNERWLTSRKLTGRQQPPGNRAGQLAFTVDVDPADVLGADDVKLRARRVTVVREATADEWEEVPR